MYANADQYMTLAIASKYIKIYISVGYDAVIKDSLRRVLLMGL